MNKLWAFGDSFTFGHGCRPDGPTSEYYHDYRNEGDKIWVEWLSEWLKLEPKNYGICGASNDMIIDTIIDNWDKITKNDYVFISMTWSQRFDVPTKNKLIPIFWDWENLGKQNTNYTDEEIETILNFQYFFSNSELYKLRHIKRFNFFEKSLKKMEIKSHFWSSETYDRTTQFERIKQHTNGLIQDSHFSFKGHKELAEILLKKIKNPTLI